MTLCGNSWYASGPTARFASVYPSTRSHSEDGICTRKARELIGSRRYHRRQRRILRSLTVSTVSMVCAIKAPVPVQARGGLDPPQLHCR